MTFLLVIDHKFRISPLFSVFQYISPLFGENYYFPPPLNNFPPILEKFTCFLRTLCVFPFPPTLTMMHLCITQCTYRTPLRVRVYDHFANFYKTMFRIRPAVPESSQVSKPPTDKQETVCNYFIIVPMCHDSFALFISTRSVQ